MSRFHAHHDGDDAPLASPPPSLRAVSRSAPLRPGWRRLYVALIAVSGLGLVAHLVIPHPALRTIADGGCALGLFAILVDWLRRNRVALARAEEPDAGVGTPGVRIVRSRPRPKDDERVHLPFDFR